LIICRRKKAKEEEDETELGGLGCFQTLESGLSFAIEPRSFANYKPLIKFYFKVSLNPL